MLGFIGLASRHRRAEPDTETADAVEQGPPESETDLAQTQAAAREERLAEKRRDLWGEPRSKGERGPMKR